MNLTRLIMEILGHSSKPLSLDEISFRSRSPQTPVYYTLQQLEKANVVIRDGYLFTLNRHQEEYNFKSLVA